MSRSRQREVKVDGALPRNQARGSVGMRVHDDERVHPAAMGRRDEQVAAASAGAPGRRSGSGTGRRRSMTNRATSRRQPVQERRLGLGRAAEPGEPLRPRRRGPRRAPRATTRRGRRPPAARPRAAGRRRSRQAGGGVGLPASSRRGARRRRRRRRRPASVGASSADVGVVGRRRSLGSTGRPSAPQVATSGMRRRIVVRVAGPVPPREDRRAAGTMNATRDDLRGRDPEERPVVVRGTSRARTGRRRTR